MHKVKLLSAALLTAATFATPVLAATSRHVVTDSDGRMMSTMHRGEGDSCIRAPRVGAYASEPWTVPPCEPHTGY
ncbi:hypothetical protein V1294_006147 [Bradyrhizobium sp. AZCC 1678]|uniref:hypothetical protein n=1 Tax=Bradyrhizobium sp. AZCC 1678 TaxID=3117030 RepID=UPI002FF2C9BC